MNIAAIKQTCTPISDKGYLFLYSHLSKRKQLSMREHLHIPKQEQIAVFIDTTLYQSCQFGLAIGEEGLYWRNYWLNPTKHYFLSWKDFLQKKLRITENQTIQFDGSTHFDASGCRVFINDLLHLLHSLQQVQAPKPKQDTPSSQVIPSDVKAAVQRQFVIFEIKSNELLFQNITQALTSPYQVQKQSFKLERDYYSACTQTLLKHLKESINKHPNLSNYLLQISAAVIEELSKQNELWVHIHANMQTKDTRA